MTDTELPTIWEAMTRVREKLGPMEKERVQNFTAFTVDTVYSTIRPALIGEGINWYLSYFDVEYLDRTDDKGRHVIDARVQGAWTFVGPAGDSFVVTGGAEGRDYQDKATNKALQQAFKYALIQSFMISTGEVDPDAEAIEVTAPETRVAPAPTPLRETLETVLDLAGGDKAEARRAWDAAIAVLGVQLDEHGNPPDADLKALLDQVKQEL